MCAQREVETIHQLVVNSVFTTCTISRESTESWTFATKKYAAPEPPAAAALAYQAIWAIFRELGKLSLNHRTPRIILNVRTTNVPDNECPDNDFPDNECPDIRTYPYNVST